MGIKVIVTHPLTTAAGHPLSLDRQKELAERGAYIEHCYIACTHPEQKLHPMRIVEAVRAVGAERCILDTDFGQDYNPPPAEGMKMMAAALKECGLDDGELELAMKTNPARLLGIH
jgi:predicted metal-dependent TIM-barrel fold hydrolase